MGITFTGKDCYIILLKEYGASTDFILENVYNKIIKPQKENLGLITDKDFLTYILNNKEIKSTEKIAYNACCFYKQLLVLKEKIELENPGFLNDITTLSLKEVEGKKHLTNKEFYIDLDEKLKKFADKYNFE